MKEKKWEGEKIQHDLDNARLNIGLVYQCLLVLVVYLKSYKRRDQVKIVNR